MQNKPDQSAPPAEANDSRTASDKAVVCKELLGRAVVCLGTPYQYRHPKTGMAYCNRGQWLVECVCGRKNNFDALAWGAHQQMRCKGCGAFIDKRTRFISRNRKLLRELSYQHRPNEQAEARGTATSANQKPL